MKKSFLKMLQGYQEFREKYVLNDYSVMEHLSDHGQKPEVMIVSCCDSRVDPALILQCDPGDLFIARNVANIIPPYSTNEKYLGISAALEFGVCGLQVKHLIILGHSQCGGIEALLDHKDPPQDDFISKWVSFIESARIYTLNHPSLTHADQVDECAKQALMQSYQNCLSFPWIKEKFTEESLAIHVWFFDIKEGQIFSYNKADKAYHPLGLYKWVFATDQE